MHTRSNAILNAETSSFTSHQPQKWQKTYLLQKTSTNPHIFELKQALSLPFIL